MRTKDEAQIPIDLYLLVDYSSKTVTLESYLSRTYAPERIRGSLLLAAHVSASRVIGLNVEHHGHKQFPESKAFVLDNPIRRLLSPPKRLISKINIGSQDVVVDFGCGPGFFLIPLAKAAGKAIGVDVSPRMLEKAAEHAKKELSAIELLQSDGTNLRLDNGSVDLILLNHVFHEVQDKTRVLGEFHRILKPSGRLAIVERTRQVNRLWAKFGPPRIDEKELANDVQQTGFRIVESIPHGTDSIVIAQKANIELNGGFI